MSETLARVPCFHCKKYFYADEEEDMINEKFYCDDCMERIKQCICCGKVTVLIRRTKIGEGLCSDCVKKDERVFPNAWLILRFKTFKRDNFRCRYCGRSPLTELNVQLHCDHIIPKSKEGEDKLENLVTSCAKCNLGKMGFPLKPGQVEMIKNRKEFPNDPNTDYLKQIEREKYQ